MNWAWLSLPWHSHGTLIARCLGVGALLLAVLEAWGDRSTVLDEDGESWYWLLMM
jgi:hypothetical protein